jgi:hypothetical protein
MALEVDAMDESDAERDNSTSDMDIVDIKMIKNRLCLPKIRDRNRRQKSEGSNLQNQQLNSPAYPISYSDLNDMSGYHHDSGDSQASGGREDRWKQKKPMFQRMLEKAREEDKESHDRQSAGRF